MDKIEKIHQEIERHRQVIRVLNEHTAPEQTSKTCAIFQYSDTILSELLSFLDTLSDKPDNSLEEAAEEYTEGYDTFAEWTEYYGAFETVNDIPLIEKAFIAGANWHKEKMLKDAVEGEVVKDINNKLAVTAKNVNLDKLKFGDKVHIIIVKEG